MEHTDPPVVETTSHLHDQWSSAIQPDPHPVLHGIKTAPSPSILNIRHYDDGSEMKRKGQKLPRKYQNLLQLNHKPRVGKSDSVRKKDKNHLIFLWIEKSQNNDLKVVVTWKSLLRCAAQTEDDNVVRFNLLIEGFKEK